MKARYAFRKVQEDFEDRFEEMSPARQKLTAANPFVSVQWHDPPSISGSDAAA